MNTFAMAKTSRENAQTIVTRRHEISGAAILWTDGACEPNPGIGGWGYRFERQGHEPEEGFGGDAATTNNRMELLAIIEGVKAAPAGVPLIVRTDSRLCVLCAVGRWARKVNLDLWRKLADAVEGRTVVFEWWRGHCGTPGNERADELAAMGRQTVIESSDDERAAMRELREIAAYG